MATRWYLRATATPVPANITPDSDWEDITFIARAICRTHSTGDAMADVAIDDADSTNRDIIARQYISLPLAPGQTITGEQAIKAQVRASETNAQNNVFLTLGIRVIASDGTTVRKTVLAVTRDDVEILALSEITNRQFTATSAATDYTTVSGDRLVFELGAGGDPSFTSPHDFTLRLGDAAASDLPEDDTNTTDLNPWIELEDDLKFVSPGGLMMLGAGA